MPRGLTILEMLLVLGVLALLAAAGTGLSFAFLRSQRLAATAELIAVEIRRAQTESYIQTNDQAHGVAIFESQVVRFEGSSYASRDPAEDQVTAYTSEVAVDGDAEVVFATATLWPNQATATEVREGDQYYQVTVSAYGLVETTKGSDEP